MRIPIDFLIASIERRLVERISVGDGAVAQALANRNSAKSSLTAFVDPTATAVHLMPAVPMQPFEADKFAVAGSAPCSIAGKGALVVDSTVTTVHVVPVTSLSATCA